MIADLHRGARRDRLTVEGERGHRGREPERAARAARLGGAPVELHRLGREEARVGLRPRQSGREQVGGPRLGELSLGLPAEAEPLAELLERGERARIGGGAVLGEQSLGRAHALRAEAELALRVDRGERSQRVERPGERQPARAREGDPAEAAERREGLAQRRLGARAVGREHDAACPRGSGEREARHEQGDREEAGAGHLSPCFFRSRKR